MPSQPGTSRSLERMFSPRAVAFVGASPDTSRYGGRVLSYLQEFGYRGDIWPVSPRHQRIGELPCFPSLKDLPGVPDHVGIAVAAERVMEALQHCAEIGVPFVTVFTAGFGETGAPDDRRRQDEMVAFARRHGIGLLGPNCNGLVNWHHRFAMIGSATPVVHGDKPAGHVAIVSQSGALGSSNVMLRAIQAGLGISAHASCGNEADISMLEIVDFLVGDPHTQVILMVAERISDGERLRRVAAKAADQGKPILIQKLGRTEAGRRAAVSHTGSMTGSDEVHDAVFRQCGILRFHEPSHLYQAAMLLQQRRRLTAEGVASISTSGGNVVLAADLAGEFGLAYPPYRDETRARIAGYVPGFITVDNPTDLSPAAIGNPAIFKGVLEAMASDPGIGVILPITTFVPRRDVEAVIDFGAAADKPVALIWTGGATDAPFRETDHIDRGVPIYRDTDTALRAIQALVTHRRFLARHAGRKAPQRPHGIDAGKARALLLACPDRVVPETTAKQVLAAYGFSVPREILAREAGDAGKAVSALGGKVVLKVVSADIPHKSDAGGVRLGIATAAEAETAFADIVRAAKSHAPAARIEGVLVQEMAGPGLEAILGMTTDPAYGPVVAAGIGGVLVEVLADRALRLPPLDHEEADQCLQELRGRALFGPVRGAPPRDRAALADLLVRLSWLAADLADIVEEIDVNPVIVHAQGAVAVDALIVRKAAT